MCFILLLEGLNIGYINKRSADEMANVAKV